MSVPDAVVTCVLRLGVAQVEGAHPGLSIVGLWVWVKCLFCLLTTAVGKHGCEVKPVIGPWGSLDNAR